MYFEKGRENSCDVTWRQALWAGKLSSLAQNTLIPAVPDY